MNGGAAGANQVHPDISGGIVLPQGSLHKIILQMLGGTAKKIDIPENARGPQLVLILEVGAVGPFENENVDTVDAGAEKSSDVELRGGMGNLAVADEGAVHPEIEAAVHSLKAQDGFFI